MIPPNVRLLESATRDLRGLRESDRSAFDEVIAALGRLGRSGPPDDVYRHSISVSRKEKKEERVPFYFDAAGRHVFFEGDRIVMRTTEGWDVVRGFPNAGESGIYTIWSVEPL